MSSGDFTNSHPALAEFWHPVAFSGDLGQEPVGVRLAGSGWALARIGGAVAAFADACPHRRARPRALSGLEFPLDINAELHTRADRISVEFRRVLANAVSEPVS